MQLSDIVRDIKANSSRHMNDKIRGFSWQDGYGAISISPSQKDVLRNYIAHQQEHHSKRTFDEEYVALLKKAGVLAGVDEILG